MLCTAAINTLKYRVQMHFLFQALNAALKIISTLDRKSMSAHTFHDM